MSYMRISFYLKTIYYFINRARLSLCRTIWILELPAILRSHPRFNLSGVHFCKSASRWQHSSSAENPLSSERSAAAPARLHLSRWSAPSFRLVPGSPIPQRREGTGGRGLDVNAAPSPSPLPNPFSTRNRAIYRPPAGQPSLPFPRSKGGKSRVSRQNRDGRRWTGFPERWLCAVPVINSHPSPTDGPRIEFTGCIRVSDDCLSEWPSLCRRLHLFEE